MGTSMSRDKYEQFLWSLKSRTAQIDYDARHDSLYVFGEERWRPEIQEKPSTVAVTGGIHLDILPSNGQIYVAELDDFQAELIRHGDHRIISWWDGIPKDEPASVDGSRLVEAIQHASLALSFLTEADGDSPSAASFTGRE